MKADYLKIFILLFILLIVQVQVFNQIHLFGCATPLLYAYVPLLFARNYPRWATVVWSFLIGLFVDIFTNTPGVAAASMTLLGFLQPFLLLPFMNRDTPDDFAPSIRQMGFGKFAWYALIGVMIYCIAYYSLEFFSFFNFLMWLENVVGSGLLTFVFILILENFRSK